jgi:hypothetical protein
MGKNNFLIIRLLWACAVILGGGGVVWSAETLPRSLDVKVEVGATGGAVITRLEKVPGSPLGQLYSDHGKILAQERRVRDEYLKELAQGYQYILGVRPMFKLDHQEATGALERTLTAKVSSLARADAKDKSLRDIRVRQFSNPRQLAPYYEYVLDGKLFETTFLGSVKGDQAILSRETTEFVLPPGSAIANVKELDKRSWKVDFGGGSLMEASLAVDEKAATVTLSERITVSEDPPKRLLAKDNTALFDQLREYAAFIIQYRPSAPVALLGPQAVDECEAGAGDFSNSWSFGLSETFSEPFTYQQVVTLTPSVTVGFTLGAEVKWDWRWYWSGWSLHCALDYFQTKITLAPAVGASINVNASAAINKEWEKNVVTKSKSITFSVACVPVLIVLEANFKLKGSCGISGGITVGTGGNVTLNTALTCKYQNGWQQIQPSFTVTPQFTGSAHASTGITSTARGEAPFTVSAYIYYVAGPFARITPYIETTSQYVAQTGGPTGVHFNLHGGFVASGGAKVAGWLQGLLGNLGEFNRDFYTKDVTIYDGWAN